MPEEKTEWLDAKTFMHFIPTSNDFDKTARMFDALEKYPREMVCINDDIDYDRTRFQLVFLVLKTISDQNFL